VFQQKSAGNSSSRKIFSTEDSRSGSNLGFAWGVDWISGVRSADPALEASPQETLFPVRSIPSSKEYNKQKTVQKSLRLSSYLLKKFAPSVRLFEPRTF
jgi:hypothetical protein